VTYDYYFSCSILKKKRFSDFISLTIDIVRDEVIHVHDEVYNLNVGEEQGISSWVAVNYALGNLGREPQETTGIVELGGASLQVFSFTIYDNFVHIQINPYASKVNSFVC